MSANPGSTKTKTGASSLNSAATPEPGKLDPATLIPGGGLDAHEGARIGRRGGSAGHTKGEHVGRSEQELNQRLTQQAGLSMASSFGDLDEAEASVAQVLDSKHAAIEAWLQDPNGAPRKIVRATVDGGVGSVVARGSAEATSGNQVVVVLAKPHRSVSMSYVILTAYPTSTRRR